jgi:hypothetical protein
MSLTVAQKLNIASISEYIITNAIAKGGLYAGGIDLDLPQKIYNIRTTIQYLYEADPSDDSLQATTNYLYAMCGKFGLAAQAVLQIAGTIAGTSGAAAAPNPYQFTVAASGTFLVDGDTSKTITAFIGYNLLYIRNGITQYTVNDGSGSYYSWTKATGSFTTTPAVATTEIIGLFAV